ncbi:MAG: hypothetical protein KGQ58_00210 [Proteobacteria bacterium]|nr:hypothetical protein [Pseudomonadota bacterium]
MWQDCGACHTCFCHCRRHWSHDKLRVPGARHSANKPGIQGRFDWSGPTGWPAGARGSSISSDVFQNQGRVNEETDFYGGIPGPSCSTGGSASSTMPISATPA